MPRGGARPGAGRKEGSQNFTKIALLAAEGVLTRELIQSDLLNLESKDRVGATIKFAEISLKTEQHDLHMETEPQLAKARLNKLHAETAAAQLTIDEAKGKTIDQAGPELLAAIKSSEQHMDEIVEKDD